MYYVYLHIERDTGCPFYVGKGVGSRLCEGRYRTKHWDNVANKHGWYADIIAEFDLEGDAFQCEKDVITFFGRRDLGTGILVNMTDGGEGLSNLIRSDEHKRNISRSKIGKPRSEETRRKLSHALTGKTLSVETRSKISNSMKGKQNRLGTHQSPEARRRISAGMKVVRASGM